MLSHADDWGDRLEKFNPSTGFAGSAPGQDLSSVVARLTTRDLQTVVGDRLLPLLPGGGSRRDELERAAAKVVRERLNELLGVQEVRSALLRNLDPGKLDELKARLGAPLTGGLEIPELNNPGAAQIVAGFFGLSPLDAALAPAALPIEEVAPHFSLFPHQRSVVARAYEKIRSGSGRTIIHMPTGSGKTRTAMHLVSRVLNEYESGVVVWLASSQELLEQATETFATAWRALGNRPLPVIRYWGRYSQPPRELDAGFVVAGLGKLHAWRQRNPVDFLRLGAKTRLVVMDEAHQAIAPTYRALIDGLCSAGSDRALVGLTATPGRTWNDIPSDQELSDYFGANKVVLEVEGEPNAVKYLLDKGYLASPTFRQIAYNSQTNVSQREHRALADCHEYSEADLDRLATDAARNIAILESVDRLIQAGHRRIILFAAGVRHAADLTIALASRGVRAELVTGETPSGKRASILNEFKRASDAPMVVCNFGVLTTGFDAPLTSAAVIARPTKSLVLYSQMVGRATRGVRAGGNETCEILTVHDPQYPGFGDIAEAFFNWEDVWSNEDE